MRSTISAPFPSEPVISRIHRAIKDVLGERSRRWRETWVDRLDEPEARRKAKLDMMVYDHGALREFYSNQAKVGEGVYRSSQPSPRRVRLLAEQGFRTILNLRGENNRGSYFLEKEAAAEAGIAFVDFRLQSAYAPPKESILAFAELFPTLERPVLMHCKSGADRVGLGSVLYQLTQDNVDIDTARKQLSLRFLHVRGSRAGVLDEVFDTYARFNAATPKSFLDWVREDYDPAEIQTRFKRNQFWDVLTFGLMRRE